MLYMSLLSSVSAKKAKTTLKEFQVKLQPVIDRYFDEHISSFTSNYGSHSVDAVHILKEFMTRGAKRLRGSFVYHTYKMCDGEDEASVLQVALAVELIHAYLLIEDDFMDLSQLRRGDLTAHEIFTKQYIDQKFNRQDAKHFGDSIAVTTGLVGSHMAMQIILELNVSDSLKVKLLNNLNKKIEITGYGQIADVYNSVKAGVSEEEVLNMLNWKTGVYTYENPLHLGAILAGASDAELEHLTRFAIPAGIAFQIQDDILGIFGDVNEMGKSNMDDIKEGKYTLLIHKALERGNSEEKEFILNVLGKRDLTIEEHAKVQQIIVNTGSLEYTRNLAKKYVYEAKEALLRNKNEKWIDENFNYLIGIADYMIERSV